MVDTAGTWWEAWWDSRFQKFKENVGEVTEQVIPVLAWADPELSLPNLEWLRKRAELLKNTPD